MGKFRIGFRVLAVVALLAGLSNVAMADPPPTAETLLKYRPAQKGVEITEPPDASGCVVELEKGKALAGGRQPTAWVLKDGQGRVLRKFHDTVGAGGVNMYAYYRDGEEAYRDLVNANRKVDQFRWLGPNGSKWGVDLDGDGKIDSWIAISPEELSQEVLAAVVTQDARRLEALLITKADLDVLGLPQPEVDRIQTKVAATRAQFQKTCLELAKLNPKTFWVHLETKLPQTIPADSIDAKADFVRYRHATILYQEGDGEKAKHNWLQTGELIQVGKAWKIIQAPTPGMQSGTDDNATVGPGNTIHIPEGAKKFIEELDVHDKIVPALGRDALIAHNVKRANILEQIAALYTKAEDSPKRDVWIRQIADSYAAAAQQGDLPSLKRLGVWREALAKSPGAILPYVMYREMTAEYAQELPKVGNDQEKLNKLQEGWKAKLTKFVADHPATEDTPDAILQLGMVNEYFGGKMEGEAKAAYALLIKNFPKNSLAARAQGCLERLTLEGKAFALAAPVLGTGATFNISTLQGKAVVVYYWASWNNLAASDFNKIKAALAGVPGKAEVVGVNLDNKPDEALAFLKANQMVGTQLYIPGGQESPLAVQYGITALPVMFLVGPDGKVVSRQVQPSNLDDELRKLFKAPEKDK
jgi:Thioredoxin-like